MTFTMTPTRTYTLTLIAVTAVSLAGNVAHAIMRHNAVMPIQFTVLWFAVPPLLLPLAVHVAGLLARRPQVSLAGADWRYRITHGWVHRVTVTGVAAVAAGTFAVSFVALQELTSAMGAPDLVAVLMPVTLDLLAGLATVALLTEQRDGAVMRTADATASTNVHQSDDLAPGDADDGLPTSAAPATASGTDTGDDAPAPLVRHAPTSTDALADAPAARVGHQSDAPDAEPRTADFDVVRTPSDDVHQGDALADLAEALVRAGRTTADPETVHIVLMRTVSGASSRRVAEEVDGLSYSAVQRIVRAAREMGELPTADSAPSPIRLVG